MCSIRPEDFVICNDNETGIRGTVKAFTSLGLNTHYSIELEDGDTVEIVEESSIKEELQPGQKVTLHVKEEKINVFNKQGDTNLVRSGLYEEQ